MELVSDKHRTRLAMIVMTGATASIVRETDANLTQLGVTPCDAGCHLVYEGEEIAIGDFLVGSIALVRGLIQELADRSDHTAVELADMLATATVVEETMDRG